MTDPCEPDYTALGGGAKAKQRGERNPVSGFDIEKVPADKVEFVEMLNDCLADLRQRARSSVRAKDPSSVPKLVWKIEVFEQALIHRAIALTEGACNAWNNDNGLAAIILARAVLETAAIGWDTVGRLRPMIEVRDTNGASELLDFRAFASRIPDWIEEVDQATNVLTLIERMGRDLAGGKDELLKRYAVLSDISHPNYVGHMGLFGKADRDNAKWKFDMDHALQPAFFAQATVGLTGVAVLYRVIGDLREHQAR